MEGVGGGGEDSDRRAGDEGMDSGAKVWMCSSGLEQGMERKGEPKSR